MQAQVIRAFRDKENKEQYVKKDSVYEGTEERITELTEKGFVKPIDEGSGEEGFEIESILESARTHSDLDKVVEELKLEGIPTKEDDATMDERKQAILEAAENFADKPPEEGE